jgi:two-component sensor histidine kinase
MLSAVLNQETALKLAQAVISASAAPLLLLDGDLRVVGASDSFGRAFGVAVGGLTGQPLRAVGGGAWDRPDVIRLLASAAAGSIPIESLELDFDLNGACRRLVLTVQKLPDPNPMAVWLLVTVADVTEVRANLIRADNLLREKTILLQEVQHRTANSLQVIASLLLQSARKVQESEARDELTLAHGRVLSIAAVQQQLAASTLSAVALRPYLTELCQGLARSMFPDAHRMSLTVDCSEVMVSARTSVSLGLIVTELIINAVKHAFPDGRSGQIRVSYVAVGDAWSLSVADNGVGLPKGPAVFSAGLGRGIVQALAHQLGAVVTMVDAHPGLSASVAHGLAAVEGEAC